MYFTTFQKHTTSGTDILDISHEVETAVAESKITNGLVTVGVPGSTASITTIEFESGVVNDLRKAIDRIAPSNLHYDHDERWGDGNGYSHVRAALMGPSVSIPLRDGHLVLGTWQQLVLCDFDNRGRSRNIYVQVLGQ